MRTLPGLTLLAALLLASSALAGDGTPDGGADADTSPCPVVDVPGSAEPGVSCRFVWDSESDIGPARAQAHEACHTVQQQAGRAAAPLGISEPGQASRACEPSGSDIMNFTAARSRDAGARCADATKGADAGPAAPACITVGDLTGDGIPDLVTSSCDGKAGIAIDEPGVHRTCQQGAAVQKSKHDAAMAAIQNTR